MIPSTHDESTQSNPWRNLWEQWFNKDGLPWCHEESQGTCYCFFCDGRRPEHAHDCLYVRAKQLLKQSKETTK